VKDIIDKGDIRVMGIGDLEMEKKVSNGKTIYKFDFALEVILGHERGTIAFRIRAYGKEVGRASLALE
jgi:hypothetical protein